MTASDHFKKNKRKVIFKLVGLFLIFIAYKVLSFILGFGISFPPNKCDLQIGYELVGDVIHLKRQRCIRETALEKQSPYLCKKLGKYGSDTCLIEVAKRGNELSTCNMISRDYYKEDCFYSFAKEMVSVDINKSLEICGKKENTCHNRIIKDYQRILGIEGKKLVYRCLNFQEGDEITRLLCSLNINYLVNWEAHHELVYMYGNQYPSMGSKLCAVVEEFSDSAFQKEFCHERVASSTKEMERVGSTFYNFLLVNPNGLGEPQ